MKILLTAATVFEIEPTVLKLRARAEAETGNVLRYPNGVTIEVLFTGVGQSATAYALGRRFGSGDLPSLAVQAGVGGALDPGLRLGEVVRISTEIFGDLGAEESDGALLSLTDIGLHPGPPFDHSGHLRAPAGLAALPFAECTGLTVNQVSGTAETITRRRNKYPTARVESMEGAAFFYACLHNGVEPLQLRAISNYVEPRNRDNWRMGEAIGALNEALWRVLGAFL